MKTIISFVLLLWLPSYIHPECCSRVEVNFVKSNGDVSCTAFGANIPYPAGDAKSTVDTALSKVTASIQNNECSIRICGDGKPPVSGHYCGRGPCNIFGCNCEHGCISGNPIDEFKSIHGDAIKKAWYGFLDKLKYHKKSCCVKLFENEEWSGKMIEICDCDETCINLSDDWKNVISSAKLNISNNLMLYSQENCEGEELKVSGSIGLFSGINCRRNFGDDSLFSGCSTKALNDNSNSIKILHKSAIGSVFGTIG